MSTSHSLIVLLRMVGFAICTLCLSTHARAQDSTRTTRIAVFAQTSGGAGLSFDRTAGRINTFSFGGSGTSSTTTVGLGLAFRPLREVPLYCSVGYEYASSSFTSDNFLTSDLSTGTVGLDRFRVDATEHKLLVEAGYPVSLGAVRLSGALWSAVRLSNAIAEYEELQSPEPTRFADGTRTRIIASGDTISSPGVHWGPALQCDVPLSIGKTELTPGIVLRYDVTSGSDLGAKALSIGARVSVSLLRSTPTPAVPSPRDSLPVPQSSPVEALTVHMLAPDGSSTLRAIPTQLRYKQYVQVATAIGFSPASLSLPAMAHVLTPHEAQRFTLDSLANLTPLQQRAHLLDIVGYRLRENPTARLTLRGAWQDAAGRSLFLDRVRVLKKYWSDVWKIRADRVVAGETASAKAGADRITLESADPNILAPLVTQWIGDSYDIPAVSLRIHTPDVPATVSLVLDGRALERETVVTHDTTLALTGESPLLMRIRDHLLTKRSPDNLALMARLSSTSGDAYDTMRVTSETSRDPQSVERKRSIFSFLPEDLTDSSDREGVEWMLQRIQALLPVARSIHVSMPPIGQTTMEAMIRQALQSSRALFETTADTSTYDITID